ncbi:MAG: N-acetyltransferase family protein [Thermoplasmatota archaeon]
MNIRYADINDLEFLKEGLLNVRLIERRPKGDVPVNEGDIKSFRQGIENGTIVIAENDEGSPAGFVYFRTDFPIPYVSGEYLWIDIIYVKEAERGKGYGSALYREAMEYARSSGLDRIVIDIFDVNERSKAFHSRMDFNPFYTIYIKDIG